MAQDTSRGTLGTFAGVFTPSILTILGIILFLRLGFVVGNAGLRNALIVILIANAVSVLTSISLAAIATNIDVKGGGDYYMISRTLGVEFGGAIGVVLFMAQSVSIAFYAVGFGEAVAAVLGVSAGWAVQVIALVAVFGLVVLAWLGADVASRFQFGIMALLIAALVSFYAGAVGGFDSGMAAEGWSSAPGGLGFWAVFAIFFPAVTGFTQGVSMSGDLRDPGRSLPLGTFGAVALSIVVYVSVAVLLAGNASSGELIADTNIMNSVAAFGPLIAVGVIAATLSSAMASFLGAPRILQSLAADRVFPILNPFSVGHGPTANPRRGVLASLIIALATVAIGNLNAIAPVVSMFFLISYGLLNYATYYEARAASPSFRPRFRYFDRRLSLAGTLLCLGAMIAINVVAGLAALLVLGAIHQYLRRSDRPERWADASRSYYFQRAVESIEAMTAEEANPRSWRPQVLAFSADPVRRERLLEFASWLEGDSGLTAIIEIVVGEGAIKRAERSERQEELQREIDGLGLDVHGRTVLAPDAMEALPVIVQSFGLGPLKANTVLFGWPENPDPHHLAGYAQAVREINRLGVSVVSMQTDGERWRSLAELPAKQRRIDVWWENDDASRQALLAGYLFTRTAGWSRAEIRVLATIENGDNRDEVIAELEQLLQEARIPARAECIGTPDVASIAATSAGSAFVFLPGTLHRGEFVGPFGLATEKVLADLPSSAVVIAGAPFVLVAGPETEHHERLVAAEEAVQIAEQRLRTLERQKQRLVAEVELRQSDDVSSDDLAAAQQRSATLERRILKAQAKVDTTRADLSALLAESGTNGA